MKLRRFQCSAIVDSELIAGKQIIFDKYKYGLRFIGVDFNDELVQEALLLNNYGFEEALQATIAYWYWLSQRQEPFYASACLIKALNECWSGRYWKDEYLDNPNFRNPRDIFWDEAAHYLGRDLRNQAIVDIVERDDEEYYVIFCSGRSLSLLSIKSRGWNWLIAHIQLQIEEKRRHDMILHSFRQPR